VPPSAITALKKRIAESATLTLSATNANGKSTATAKLAKLSLKK